MINSLEKLAVLAELHKDIDLVVLADDFVDLGDVLMHQVLLQLNLTLDGFQLLRLVLLDSGDLDSYGLTCQFMHSFLDFTETSLTDGFSCVTINVLSS